MNSRIQEKRPEVEAVCKRYGVERLDLFGSSVRDDFDPETSDFDFLVRFSPPHSHGYADRYLDLAQELEKILGAPVDLLTERSVRNPILARRISADRHTLYER